MPSQSLKRKRKLSVQLVRRICSFICVYMLYLCVVFAAVVVAAAFLNSFHVGASKIVEAQLDLCTKSRRYVYFVSLNS